MARYIYSELAPAVDSPGTHNIFAIVAECSMPRPTRGTGERVLLAPDGAADSWARLGLASASNNPRLLNDLTWLPQT